MIKVILSYMHFGEKLKINFESKEELKTKLNVFYALNRIKENEYTELTNMINKEEVPKEPII